MGGTDDTARGGGPEAAVVYDWYQEGCRRLADGNPRGAVEILELAVEREPGKASLREALARSYFAASRVRRAREEFAQALALDPTDHYAHFGVGRCHERLGELRDAAKYFRLACAMAPKRDYQDALARVETRLG